MGKLAVAPEVGNGGAIMPIDPPFPRRPPLPGVLLGPVFSLLFVPSVGGAGRENVTRRTLTRQREAA